MDFPPFVFSIVLGFLPLSPWPCSRCFPVTLVTKHAAQILRGSRLPREGFSWKPLLACSCPLPPWPLQRSESQAPGPPATIRERPLARLGTGSDGELGTSEFRFPHSRAEMHTGPGRWPSPGSRLSPDPTSPPVQQLYLLFESVSK